MLTTLLLPEPQGPFRAMVVPIGPLMDLIACAIDFAKGVTP